MITGIFAYDGWNPPTIPKDIPVYLAKPGSDIGTTMNEGIDFLMDKCDNIIFFGPGCDPQGEAIHAHSETLSTHMYPLVTCGRVRHEADGWKDFREVGRAAQLKLFGANGTIIQNASVLLSGYGISVANFGMNRSAIDRMARFTRQYFDSDGPFPVIRDATLCGYGKVLSMCAWCARVTIFMLPDGYNSVIYSNPECNPYAGTCDGDTSREAIVRISTGMAERPPDLNFFDSVNDRPSA